MDELKRNEVRPAGSTIKLRCPASGNPTPNITWLKNNQEPKRTLGAIVKNKWTLKLEDVVLTDKGNYTCIVCNYLSCVHHTIKVDVIGEF